MKKTISVILCMILILSIAPSSFAGGTDTLADWNIRITVPEGKTAVLEGKEYYIYAQQEGYIPYVMLRTYHCDDAEAFIAEFTAYMQRQYADLKVVSEAEQKTIGDKRCFEIDYAYTVKGYDVRDRRVVMTAGDTTYMFASKEIESKGLTVGSMLDDVVADCELLGPGAEDVLTGPDSEFMSVTGLNEMEKALNNGAAIESVYYTDGYGFSVSEFTTTDPQEMTALWNAVTKIRLGDPSGMSITDWYPLIVFYLDDGTRYGVRFEGKWLTVRTVNYEIENAGQFWSLTSALVQKYRK